MTCKLEYVGLQDVLPQAWLNSNPLDLAEVYPSTPALQLVSAGVLRRVCSFRELWGPDVKPEDIQTFKDNLESLGPDICVKIY